MRATFITTALENGAQLEDVQKAVPFDVPIRPPFAPSPAVASLQL
jgi:hypothetical protein